MSLRTVNVECYGGSCVQEFHLEFLRKKIAIKCSPPTTPPMLVMDVLAKLHFSCFVAYNSFLLLA